MLFRAHLKHIGLFQSEVLNSIYETILQFPYSLITVNLKIQYSLIDMNLHLTFCHIFQIHDSVFLSHSCSRIISVVGIVFFPFYCQCNYSFWTNCVHIFSFAACISHCYQFLIYIVYIRQNKKRGFDMFKSIFMVYCGHDLPNLFEHTLNKIQ